jgi:hypothetical protein
MTLNEAVRLAAPVENSLEAQIAQLAGAAT